MWTDRLAPAVLLALAGAAPAADRPPNVVVVVADDLGYGDLGCYGAEGIKTPHLDRLAAGGVRFDRAYVQYPVCNPSRSSFLSGRRPDRTGVTDNKTLLRDKVPDVVTFPQVLKDNGWHAAAWADLPKSWHEARAFEATAAGKVTDGRNLTGGKLPWCRWGITAGRAGTSLRPLLDDPSRAGRAAAFTVVTRGPKPRGDSVRTDRWRYTEWGDGANELYDRAADPGETRNLAAVPGHAAVVKDLTAKLPDGRK